MNHRGHRLSHEVSRSIYPELHRDRRQFRAVMTAFVAAAIIAVSGCKTGGTSSSLAWWPGASKGSSDNEKLASAPSFDGKVEKPSETQSPYPTTTTPQSYALDGQKPSLASAANPSGSPSPSAGQAAVTYGLTPPPAPSNAASPTAQANTGGIAAQVGPYQGWPSGGGPATGAAPVSATSAPGGYASAATPPASPPQPATGSSAALGFGSASSMTSDAVDQPARYADARFGDSSVAAPSPSSSGFSPPVAAVAQSGAATASVSAAATTPDSSVTAGAAPASRYATSGSSQFGSESVSSPAAPAAFVPPASPVPSAAAPAAPASNVTDPSVLSPQSGANRLRAPSASTSPSAPPTRRPDPGYRPGGTSTYRPSQAIVDEPADDGPIRQASFDSPLR